LTNYDVNYICMYSKYTIDCTECQPAYLPQDKDLLSPDQRSGKQETTHSSNRANPLYSSKHTSLRCCLQMSVGTCLCLGRWFRGNTNSMNYAENNGICHHNWLSCFWETHPRFWTIFKERS